MLLDLIVDLHVSDQEYVNNIPKDMLKDQYGMAAVLAILQGQIPQSVALARYCDIPKQAVDVNPKQQLLPNFAGALHTSATTRYVCFMQILQILLKKNNNK
jgi:hypothetical protein